MNVTASAPGKVVLLGEYAVLEGTPALVAAMNRRATAQVSPAGTRACFVEAPDICPAAQAFTLDADGHVQWQQAAAGKQLALVATIVEALAAHGGLPRAGWRLRLDSSAFFEHTDGVNAKLGLGSSAAVTVACASALAVYAGHADRVADRAAWLGEVLAIHRAFQDGRGSGLDIAASLQGGELIFQPGGGTPWAEAFAWPAELERLYVWSGHSASTARFLGILAAWRQAQPKDYDARMAVLQRATEAGVAAARAQGPEALLGSVRRMAEGLREFGQASKIPVFSADHEAIAAVVARLGGAYKPCGAGGGDLGMAVVTGVDARQRVIAALHACGYGCVALETDPQGLALHVES